MKAAVLLGVKNLAINEVPIPSIKEDEVLVKVAYCGICGTDTHIFNGDEGSAKVTPPIILGHEFSGTIIAIGEHVHHLRPGDHIAVDPNYYCGTCYYCKNGREHLCSEMNAVGVTRNGGFAEYCTMPAKAALMLPKELSLKDAAFAEPLSCCLHGMDLTHIQQGDHVLIIGGGTIGIIMVQLAKISGASHISLVEPDLKKRNLALKIGADNVFTTANDYYGFMSQCPTNRADRIVECVGKPETVSFAINAATKGAIVMLFGLTPPEAVVEIKPFELFKKEIHITSSFVNPYTQTRAIDLLYTRRIQVSELVSMLIPLSRLPEVIADPQYQNKSKILIDYNLG